jgi:membrane protein
VTERPRDGALRAQPTAAAAPAEQQNAPDSRATPSAHWSWRDRLGALERRIRRLPPVRGLQAVLDAYNAAGGGLLASGLAFSALFATVPGLLLVVSVLVVVIDDPASRQAAIDWIIDQVPPLADVAEAIVQNLAESARVGTIVGGVLFLWGASGFYLALEGAMQRLFPGPGRVDPIRSRIRGVAAVALIVGAVIAAFLVSSSLTVLARFVDLPGIDVLPLLAPVVTIGGSIVVVLLTYLLVPPDPPGVRAALVPAVLAGLAIGVLTALFGLFAPLLVQGFVGLGVIASVFIALVWFNWVFQFLLYGGAFARIRRDRDRSRKTLETV